MRSETIPTTAIARGRSLPWPLVMLAGLLALAGPPVASGQELQLRGGTFLGGERADMGWSMCPAPGGDLILVGETYSNDFPVTPGAFDTTYADSSEGHFLRIRDDATGIELASYIGADLSEACRAVTLDAAGNIYIVGTTASPGFPVTPDAAFPELASTWSDAFLAVLDPTGSELLYGTFLGGRRSEKGRGVALLGPGLVAVAGYTRSDDFPTSLSGFDRTSNGGVDLFYSVFNLYTGHMIYSTYLGGSADEELWDLEARPDGTALVCGWTASQDFPITAQAYDCLYNGGSDAYVACIAPVADGLRWSTFLGGHGLDAAWEVCPVDDGGVLVVGGSDGEGFPVTAGAYDVSHNGYSDAFVLKLNGDGSELVFSTYLGGEGDDRGEAIRQGEGGVIYCCGSTYSAQFPIAGGAPFPTYSGEGDIFAAVLCEGGNRLLASTFLGGGGRDNASRLEIPGENLFTITGLTSSADFPVTSGAVDTTFNGDRDAYLATFVFCGGQAVETSSPARIGGEVRLDRLPSPVRGSANLRFRLEQPGRVRLDLLDPEGRLIETLLHGSLTAGEHVVSCPAGTGSARASPGVYWVRLETDDGAARASRVLLVR